MTQRKKYPGTVDFRARVHNDGEIVPAVLMAEGVRTVSREGPPKGNPDSR